MKANIIYLVIFLLISCLMSKTFKTKQNCVRLNLTMKVGKSTSTCLGSKTKFYCLVGKTLLDHV